MLTFHGPWRITVVTKAAMFDQRVVVRTATGSAVVPGHEGATRVVDAHTWSLSLEHNHFGRGWRANVRVIPGPVTELGGVRSQELWSTDWDFEGHDPNRRNLVVRLDELAEEQPVRIPAPQAVGIPAARPGIQTSSGSIPTAGTTATPRTAAVPRIAAGGQTAAAQPDDGRGWRRG